MAVRTRDVLGAHLPDLRYEPTAERVRAELDGAVVDSDRAVLVWEPRRVVPTCAVPVTDVHGEPAPRPRPRRRRRPARRSASRSRR
jgi:hypothetical protein